MVHGTNNDKCHPKPKEIAFITKVRKQMIQLLQLIVNKNQDEPLGA